ncbi:MAG: hypothetical protein WBG08_12235, partial [Litorimonas sp.]
MKTRNIVWTRLGLPTALAVGLAAAGCAVETESEAAAPDASSAPAVSGAVADTGAGGEGEGGVSITQAANDPVVYLSALAITEAHVLAGRDAYAAGFTDAAGEMFAHPVSEVLADMAPVFEQRGVADFTDVLLDASDAAYNGENLARIDDRVAAVVAALRQAAESAPATQMSAGEIAARVAADQIDRAADMYTVAQGSDAYEPYLDGYGFYKAALSAFEADKAAIR